MRNNLYASWQPDLEALFVDAFSSTWKEFNNFYAFPPFSLVLRCLQNVAVEKALCYYSSHVANPTMVPEIDSNASLRSTTFTKKCTQPSVQQCNVSQITQGLVYLLACPISGLISEARAFRNGLSISCATPGDHLQSSSIKSIIKSGFLSVVSGSKIPGYIMKR